MTLVGARLPGNAASRHGSVGGMVGGVHTHCAGDRPCGHPTRPLRPTVLVSSSRFQPDPSYVQAKSVVDVAAQLNAGGEEGLQLWLVQVPHHVSSGTGQPPAPAACCVCWRLH